LPEFPDPNGPIKIERIPARVAEIQSSLNRKLQLQKVTKVNPQEYESRWESWVNTGPKNKLNERTGQNRFRLTVMNKFNLLIEATETISQQASLHKETLKQIATRIKEIVQAIICLPLPSHEIKTPSPR
jgi:hypothetical protein